MQQGVKSKDNQLGAEAIKCIRCGACQAACPIFKEIGVESYVARGKIRMLRAILEGKMDINRNIDELLSYCLLCKACVSGCPAGVKTDELVEAARARVVAQRGLPLLKKAAFRIGLKNRWFFNSAMAVVPGLQWLMFREAPNGTGMLPRYPLGLDKRRLLRPVADQFFRRMYPGIARADKPNGSKIALFTGCMGNFVYPETAKAAVKVFNTNEYDVIIPRNQHCCGTPARVSGDLESAREMAKVNADEFYPVLEQVDAIIVICASCGTALKKETSALLADDPVYGPKAAAMAAKVKDFAEFVVTLPDWKKHIINGIKARVTYHDPCHLGRGQGVVAQPREIIQAIPGVEFVELPGLQVCCGSAGTFSAFHYDVSTKITRRKIQDLENTGADTIITGCSACRMQIEDGIHQAGLNTDALHTAEILWQAYKPV